MLLIVLLFPADPAVDVSFLLAAHTDGVHISVLASVSRSRLISYIATETCVTSRQVKICIGYQLMVMSEALIVGSSLTFEM